MLIGEPTAEAIKKNIGSAFPGSEVKEMEVKGRNLSEGVPRSFTISSNEILEALTDPLNQIVSAVKNALEQTPPELGADIAERGMMLTGGGALLRDLDRLLAEETGLPVLVAEDPLTCVVRGCGMALERMERLGSIFTSEACCLPCCSTCCKTWACGGGLPGRHNSWRSHWCFGAFTSRGASA
jgi:rod shape-determining protein MreB